jgi:hypothetical protein
MNRMNRTTWTFEQYLDQILSLSQICEIPEINQQRLNLIAEMWEYFPKECVMIGLTDGVK